MIDEKLNSKEEKDLKVETVEKPTVEKPIVDNDDIFITEKDRFNITICYYKKGERVLVEKIDEDFDMNNPAIKTFDVTFKYPSQADAEMILSTRKDTGEIKFLDLISLENARIGILIRGWTLNKPTSDIINIHPQIVTGIRSLVRERIGLSAII